MKSKCCVICFLCVGLALLSCKALAQDPITLIIKEAITKTIKAVDLKIQRLQNETIRLQNAQKAVENTMAKLKLQEITDWVEKQRLLYADYFEELKKVKTVISHYHRISEIVQLEIALVRNYQQAVGAVQLDNQFSLNERNQTKTIYRGVLKESLKNLNALTLLITPYATQMSDAKRIELIDAIAQDVEKNYQDLRKLITQTRQLSLFRKTASEQNTAIKDLYGIQ